MNVDPTRQPPVHVSKVDRWEQKEGRLQLKAFFYFLARIILKPFSSTKSHYFKVKQLRTEAKFEAIRKRTLFKDEHFVASGLNFPRSDLLKSGEDRTEALKLREKLKEEQVKIGDRIGRRIEFTNKPMNFASDEGRCLGVSQIAAKWRLVDKQSIEEFIPTLEKGATKEASAIQILADQFYTVSKKGDLIPGLIRSLERIKDVPGTPEILRFDPKIFEKVIDGFIKNQSADQVFEEMEVSEAEQLKMVDAAVVLFDIFAKSKDGKVTTDPYPMFEGQRVKGDSRISEFFIHELFLLSPTLYTAQVLGALNGLDVTPANMGSYLFYDTDESYLQNMDRLEDGVYLIGLSSQEGRHAITFVRENGIDWIIDPNGMQLRSEDKETTRSLLLDLLKEYEPPSWEKEGGGRHRLEFFQYKAIGEPTS
jgi:hypothetical protein